jgi:hypothetical protein
MLSRFRFAAGIAAALCLSLAACGGGGSDPSTPDASAVDPTSVVDIQRHPASVSGTAIPPATSINDSSGAVWTVKNGFIYRAGKKTISSDVILLLWYEGVIYQEDSAILWWKWKNNGWVACADPRPAVTPPVVIPPAVTPPVVIPPVVIPPVVIPPVVTPPVTTPPVVTPPVVTPPTTSAISFYGIGAHYVQGGLSSSVAFATQAASLADLGMKSYRQDMYTTSQIDTIAATVMPGLGKNVQVLPMIEAYPWDDPAANGNPTEATAYAYAYGMAAHAATKFKGIPVVEFGNEYDIDGNAGNVASDGQDVTDYNNTYFQIFRGSLRGSIDGWHSVDTGHVTKIIANASSGWLHFGFLDGMMTGKQPDGSTGHPKIAPDIIQWHWYSDFGDIEKATGGSGTYNVLSRLKSSYNLPIMITEIGARPMSESQVQSYISTTIPELVAAKATYNVIGFNWYEMYETASLPGYGLMTSGTAKKARYTTMKSVIAAAGAQ